jgi:hypothetical protein
MAVQRDVGRGAQCLLYWKWGLCSTRVFRRRGSGRLSCRQCASPFDPTVVG